MIESLAYSSDTTRATLARGRAQEILATLRRRTFEIRFAFVSATAQWRAQKSRKAGTYGHIIYNFAFCVLATWTRVALFVCKYTNIMPVVEYTLKKVVNL